MVTLGENTCHVFAVCLRSLYECEMIKMDNINGSDGGCENNDANLQKERRLQRNLILQQKFMFIEENHMSQVWTPH